MAEGYSSGSSTSSSSYTALSDEDLSASNYPPPAKITRPINQLSPDELIATNAHKEAAMKFRVKLNEGNEPFVNPRKISGLEPPSQLDDPQKQEEKALLKHLLIFYFRRLCEWVKDVLPLVGEEVPANFTDDATLCHFIRNKGIHVILLHAAMYYEQEKELFEIPISDESNIKVNLNHIASICNVNMNPFILLFHTHFNPLPMAQEELWYCNPSIMSLIGAAFFFDPRGIEGVPPDTFKEPLRTVKNLLEKWIGFPMTEKSVMNMYGMTPIKTDLYERIKRAVEEDPLLESIFNK